MDFLKLPLSTVGHQYVFLVTDHFTKYGVPSEQPLPQTDWVRTHHQKLTFAHQRAAEKLETARQQQKQAHDQCP